MRRLGQYDRLLLKIVLIGLALLLLGLIGVFALNPVWLQVLAGLVAFVGFMLSIGLVLYILICLEIRR